MKTPDTSTPVPSAPSKRNFSSKTSAREVQYERTLAMLRTGPKNTMELRRGGVMMPAARIKEMVDTHGHSISRIALIDLWDEWGFPHPRVAVYALNTQLETVGAA